jgi:hypothetical protein
MLSTRSVVLTFALAIFFDLFLSIPAPSFGGVLDTGQGFPTYASRLIQNGEIAESRADAVGSLVDSGDIRYSWTLVQGFDAGHGRATRRVFGSKTVAVEKATTPKCRNCLSLRVGLEGLEPSTKGL